MRRLLLAAMVLERRTSARAADMPDLPILRGSFPEGLSTASRNWDGWYAGGQVGYSSAEMDFGHRPTKALTNFRVAQHRASGYRSCRLAVALQESFPRAPASATFVGRNWQWDDLVFGLEANYNYIDSLASSASNSIDSRHPSIPNRRYSADRPTPIPYNVDAVGQCRDCRSRMSLTFRGRAGYAYGNFLPYVFGGLAVGRPGRGPFGDGFRKSAGRLRCIDHYHRGPVNPSPTRFTTGISQRCHAVAQTEARDAIILRRVGPAAWMEYMLWGNVFMRGEWEYIEFLTVKDMTVNMNSARAGIGYKF